MLVDDLSLIEPLGKGSFAEVFRALKQDTNEKFALKILDKECDTNPIAKKYLNSEIAIHKDIKHENIVKLYDVKKTSQNFCLVTEYCNGGSLYEGLKKYQNIHNAPFPEELVQYFMRQIISAVKYLHDKRIIHRHITLDNILVHYDSEEDKKNQNLIKSKIKIIDFGFARYLKKGELAYSTLGSPAYMDPIFLRKINDKGNSKEYGYDEKVYIWSLGTVCYEILIGHLVFDTEDYDELSSLVEKGNYFLPSTLSMEAASFLNGMLKYDPKKRFTIEQLYKHQFLNKNIKDFHKINLNKIKENVVDSKIKMNTKLNESIWDIPHEGYENYLEEKETLKKMNENIKMIME